MTSMLQVDHVTISINGSVITCYSHGDVLTISIHVINNGKWNLCKRQNSLILSSLIYAVFSTAKSVYLSLEDESGQLRVSGYESPMLEGSIITLHCNLGYVLIGSITSTCMKNGKWEPDPREVQCLGTISYSVCLPSLTTYIYYFFFIKSI